jgi:hypothetical protein
MTFFERKYRLTTHFSERVPIVKRCMSVFAELTTAVCRRRQLSQWRDQHLSYTADCAYRSSSRADVLWHITGTRHLFITLYGRLPWQLIVYSLLGAFSLWLLRKLLLRGDVYRDRAREMASELYDSKPNWLFMNWNTDYRERNINNSKKI